MNMKITATLLLTTCLFYTGAVAQTVQPPMQAVIPLGGNAWVNEPAAISDEGLTGWSDAASVPAIYFRVSKAQPVRLLLRARAPEGKSSISVSAGTTSITKEVANTAYDTIHIGTFNITAPGYVKVTLRGIRKTGAVYAQVSDLIIQLPQPDSDLVFVKPGSSFYYGRRGPSVHLRYDVPEAVKHTVKYFYSEISVPAKMDITGSYFMAGGFREGYFGMQVNSATERRILFSVWSPFNTNDPKAIPDSMKVVLVKKGDNVHANDFGNEGAGGQSFMLYPWQAGKSYGFLVCAQPDTVKNATVFTAYFKDIAAGKWWLVASFSRPQTNSYLNGLYSFVENFIPDNGDQTRMACFTHQWVAGPDSRWQPITQATLSVDATAKGNYRKDYAGGLLHGALYMKNGGFFNNFVPPGQTFRKTQYGPAPAVPLQHLPQQ
jgi:hypothetical protein